MTLKELLQTKGERLDKVPEDLISVIEKQEEKVFKQVIKDLDKLEVKEGKIVASKKNLALINGILENLKKVIFGSEYLQAIKVFANEISTQAGLTNSIMQKTADDFSDDEMFKSTVKASQLNALALLDESAIESNFLKPIAQILTNSIVSEMRFTDAIETLRNSMVGETAIYSKYAKTYIKDAFAVADRQYSELVAKKNGIEFYRYSGVKVEATRDFCNERVGKTFHRREIEDWGRFKNTDKSIFDYPKKVYTTKAGVDIYWAGMNYNTNSANIFSYLGGYECNHNLVPVVTYAVSKEDKDRAKRLGYFTE